MNSSLLAGLASGCALAVLGVVGASIAFPPAPVEERVESAALPSDAAETPTPEVAQVEDAPAPDHPAEEDKVEVEAADPATPDEPSPDPAQDTQLADAQGDEAAPESAPDPVQDILQTLVDQPSEPQAHAALGDEHAPVTPAPQLAGAAPSLPEATRLPEQTQTASLLPQIAPPDPVAPPQEQAAEAPDLPDPSTPVTPHPEEDQSEPAAPPEDERPTGLPQIGVSPTPTEPAPEPEPELERALDDLPALQRYSLYDGSAAGASKMAIILNDPGLPTPMRRSLAALELDLTIALNPLDPSATDAAQIYRDAGMEVVILAANLPQGATAADLDVNMSAFFDALPEAVAVIDLPRDGFARNARMLADILPLLAADGHGLLTFAGGLAQAARSAQAAGVAHSEVFRVLDASDESVFTIRRFLERAVFQASQMGSVIVFGDAANDATIEALSLWTEAERTQQVWVVPVSAILLGD